MIDYGPPIQLSSGPGGIIKVRRGGAVGNGNSGNGPRRFHTVPRAIRNVHGQHMPWPPRGKVIWDPTDPFIIAYQQAHPRRIEAEPRVRMWEPRRKVTKRTRVRRDFDFADSRRTTFPPYPEKHDAKV